MVKSASGASNRRACQELAEKVGDFEDLHIAEARWADIAAGRVKTLSLDSALKLLR
jgi:hypothetical protein